jgi:hypothetical protein
VDRRSKELKRAGPRYHLLWWKHRHQSTQDSGIVNGEDALQEDYLDNDIKETQIKLHQSSFPMGFWALVLHWFKNEISQILYNLQKEIASQKRQEKNPGFVKSNGLIF